MFFCIFAVLMSKCDNQDLLYLILVVLVKFCTNFRSDKLNATIFFKKHSIYVEIKL